MLGESYRMCFSRAPEPVSPDSVQSGPLRPIPSRRQGEIVTWAGKGDLGASCTGFPESFSEPGGQTVSILPSLHRMTDLVASSLCN